MKSVPQVIDYQAAPVTPVELEIRQEGEQVVIVFPPAPFWPMAIISSLTEIFACLLSGLVLLIVNEAASVLGALIVLAIAVVVLVRRIRRLVLLLRHGRSPAMLRMSPWEFIIHLPILGSGSPRRWDSARIGDISMRYAGALPAIRQYIRIQVSLLDGPVEIVLIPARDAIPLAPIEDTIGDMLARRPPDFSPT